MPRLILGIVGEKSSGKSIVFQYLKRRRGIAAVRTSDVLAEILDLLNLDREHRPYLAGLAEALRAKFGPGIVSLVALKRAQTKHKQVMVIEGMRRVRELNVLRSLKNFKLMFVAAPAELRWQWARGRALRTDDRVTLQEFKRIERTLITEVEIPRMRKFADIVVDNDGTKHELFQKVDAALETFGVKP